MSRNRQGNESNPASRTQQPQALCVQPLNQRLQAGTARLRASQLVEAQGLGRQAVGTDDLPPGKGSRAA